MKNWKTTIVGAIAGALIAIQPLLENGEIDLTALAAGFAVAFFGAVSKDFNINGTK